MQNPSRNDSLCCCNCLAPGGLCSTLFTGNCLTRPIYFAAGCFHGAPLFFHSLLPIVDNLLASVLNRLLPNLVSRKNKTFSEGAMSLQRCGAASCGITGAWSRSRATVPGLLHPPSTLGSVGDTFHVSTSLRETSPSFPMRGLPKC